MLIFPSYLAKLLFGGVVVLIALVASGPIGQTVAIALAVLAAVVVVIILSIQAFRVHLFRRRLRPSHSLFDAGDHAAASKLYDNAAQGAEPWILNWVASRYLSDKNPSARIECSISILRSVVRQYPRTDYYEWAWLHLASAVDTLGDHEQARRINLDLTSSAVDEVRSLASARLAALGETNTQ